ncbi:unnamed protein product [Schistosoma margrebowiei]|uniref:Uncharacterized protein n=1 Tax=Schistosoma margrebowiei TaxID=48269 RepID=A0A183MXW8_9TREM|nr:unnamed protein product [Schistosoma margrebowiei]
MENDGGISLLVFITPMTASKVIRSDYPCSFLLPAKFNKAQKELTSEIANALPGESYRPQISARQSVLLIAHKKQCLQSINILCFERSWNHTAGPKAFPYSVVVSSVQFAYLLVLRVFQTTVLEFELQEMVSLSEQVGAIKTIVEKHLNDSLSLRLNPVSQLDDFLNADHLPIDLSQMDLQLAITTAESILDNLRFEDEELKRDCERLSQKLEQSVARYNADLSEKEIAKKEHHLRLKTAKAKLSVYEKFTKTKFTINQDSITACILFTFLTTAFHIDLIKILCSIIFNPDDMVQLTIPETLTSTDICQMIDSLQKNVTKPILSENEIKQMKNLWDRMKVSEKWKHLIEPRTSTKISE